MSRRQQRLPDAMQAQPDQVRDRRPDAEPGLHYPCAGYKNFFRHIRKYLRAMTTLIENDLPVSALMRAVDGPLIITKPRGRGGNAGSGTAGRNR